MPGVDVTASVPTTDGSGRQARANKETEKSGPWLPVEVTGATKHGINKGGTKRLPVRNVEHVEQRLGVGRGWNCSLAAPLRQALVVYTEWQHEVLTQLQDDGVIDVLMLHVYPKHLPSCPATTPLFPLSIPRHSVSNMVGTHLGTSRGLFNLSTLSEVPHLLQLFCSVPCCRRYPVLGFHRPTRDARHTPKSERQAQSRIPTSNLLDRISKRAGAYTRRGCLRYLAT